MSKKNKPMGDTEKTVLVGALILGGWLGLDALVKRAEKRTATDQTGDGGAGGGGVGSESVAMQRARVARSRRRRRRSA